MDDDMFGAPWDLRVYISDCYIKEKNDLVYNMQVSHWNKHKIEWYAPLCDFCCKVLLILFSFVYKVVILWRFAKGFGHVVCLFWLQMRTLISVFLIILGHLRNGSTIFITSRNRKGILLLMQSIWNRRKPRCSPALCFLIQFIVCHLRFDVLTSSLHWNCC